MLACSTVALLCVCFSAYGQDTVTEPEFADVFFRLDAGKLIPLERQTATIQGKASGFIVMNAKAVSDFPGAKSPIRFASGRPLEFVVRMLVASLTEDPNALFVLRKLDVKRKSRELVISSSHFTPIGGSSKSPLAEGVLPVDFSRYGASSVKMMTVALPPGEYAVSRIHGQSIFCFGID
jgi:hypothetical protein